MTSFFQYVSEQHTQILDLLFSHIQLTILSVAVAILIGVPLGILISNWTNLNKPVLGVANVVQAIPSLAILGFLVPYMGIGAGTAVFMVVLYSLLPILKNTTTGLNSINSEMLEAARGIGMTKGQILAKVQIPLALPVIMAGVRISSVTAVGLMTIAAYIGAGGLGSLVISGIQTDNANMILAGAIPACLLALLMDFVMSKVEKAVTPISLRFTASNLSAEKIAHGKRDRRRVLAIASIAIVAVTGFLVAGTVMRQSDLSIGSKEGTESVIIGHMLADLIETKTDLKVERRMSLGGTMIAFNALSSDAIDIYPEYTGTAYGTILNQPLRPGFTSEEMYNIVKTELKMRDNIDVLDPYGFENTYVLAVRKETAEKYNLKTITDLIAVSETMKLGCSPEFAVRDDGLPGIEKEYGIKFKSNHSFSGTLMYTAIISEEVDVITAFSTDGLLQKYDLVLLEDDRHFFPPYDMLTLISGDTARKYPEAVEAMSALYGLIDNETMQALNYQVVEVGRDRAEVGRTFLIEQGLVSASDFS